MKRTESGLLLRNSYHKLKQIFRKTSIKALAPALALALVLNRGMKSQKNLKELASIHSNITFKKAI